MAYETPGHEHGAGPIQAILNWVVWVGRAAAWLILPIIFLVLVSVSFSALKVGTLVQWENDVFLFGSKLTPASLGDLQWHLFGIMLLVSLAGTLVKDRHVRVDFIRHRMGENAKAIIDLLGHLAFLMPLVFIVCWHGFEFTVRAFNFGEGSDYDGLYDRFLIKGFVPLGFVLLGIAGAGLIVQRLRQLHQLYKDKDRGKRL